MKSKFFAIIAAFCLVGCSDPQVESEAKANMLFVEASSLRGKEALIKLEEIVQQYPQTSVAVGITGGTLKVNDQTISEIKQRVRELDFRELENKRIYRQNKMLRDAQFGNTDEVMKALDNGAYINAIRQGTIGVLGMTLDPPLGPLWTALHHAASNGNKEMVNMLIEREADVNLMAERSKPDSAGKGSYYPGGTPLDLALRHWKDINDEDKRKKAEVAIILIKRGAKTSDSGDYIPVKVKEGGISLRAFLVKAFDNPESWIENH